MLRRLLAIASVLVPAVLFANPVMEAAAGIGTSGLSAKPAPAVSPTAFKPSADRPFVRAITRELLGEEDKDGTMAGAVVEVAKNFEREMTPRGFANDASAALGFAIVMLTGTATGKEVPDAAFAKLVPTLRATLDTPRVRGATDRQKQELYETSLTYATIVLAMAANATGEDAKKVGQLASGLLQRLIGASADQITVSGDALRIRAVAPPVALKPTPQPQPQPAPSSGGLAAGFQYTAPAGWNKLDGGWYALERREGDQVTTSLIRFLPAIPAAGNMGDALNRLWKTSIPAEGADRRSAVVYRRYIGNGALAQFIGGMFPEKGRSWDTHFTLMLVDCGAQWQPVVMAATWNASFTAGASMSSQLSFPETIRAMEPFLATFRSPKPAGPIVDRASLVGNYRYGSGAGQDLVNINTGASAFQFVSSGGTLNLKADGKFTYTFSSASGINAATTFRGAKGSGTWKIERDWLICTFTEYDQGDGYKVKSHRYRIAGVTVFGDGTRVAILMMENDRPVNMANIGDSGSWFTARRG